ncbi:MAG: GNAT family N-acetyltransferase [Thermodesulfobacteriota bacterium]
MIRVKVDQLRLTGYYPGIVGKITEEHAVYYYENWGFDISFETQVGRELSEFLMEFQKDRDGFWVATISGKFAGSIAIDGRHQGTEGSRLRWFIVAPRFHRIGVGKTLLSKSIDFCKGAHYKRVYLWTFKGLESARYLYEKEGFRLCKTHAVRQWGRDIEEQMFELKL